MPIAKAMRARDQGANEEIKELARTAIARIRRGQRAEDPVYQQAVAEQKERDIFDFSYFATVGNATSVRQAQRFGEEIAATLVNEGVQAVVFTST